MPAQVPPGGSTRGSDTRRATEEQRQNRVRQQNRRSRSRSRRTTESIARNHPTIAGLSASQVRAIQRKVGVTADGRYGPKTMAAVKRYQRNHGLAVDGVAGPNTLRSMGLAGGGSSGGGGGRSNSGGGSVGSDVRAGANAAASAVNTVTKMDAAARFGYTLSFFNQDKELKNLLNRAVKQNMSPDRFVAELRNTKWFRTRGEAARKYAALKSTDPGQLSQLRTAARASIHQRARQMGAVLSHAQLTQIVNDSLRLGWNDDNINAVLDDYIKRGRSGNFNGQAGQLQSQFDDIMRSYGIKWTSKKMGELVRGGIRGTQTAESVRRWAERQAISKYPSLAERIKSGETVESIADPYRQSMAEILERNPNTIKLSDRHIQRALQSKDGNGKPTTMSVYDFENMLREGPEWKRTQNAQDSAMETAHKVLSNFGLVT